MRRIIECVPNFSEGRDRETIDRIAAAIASVEGVRVLDVDPGAAANRTVITFAGAPECVVEAAFRGAREAAARIDMRLHHGEHPRSGATDVLPLVPLSGITLEKCAALARRQVAAGAVGMTCAKLSEAEDLVFSGVDDVLIANQVVEPAKIVRLALLAGMCRLTVCVDDGENAKKETRDGVAGIAFPAYDAILSETLGVWRELSQTVEDGTRIVAVTDHLEEGIERFLVYVAFDGPEDAKLRKMVYLVMTDPIVEKELNFTLEDVR